MKSIFLLIIGLISIKSGMTQISVYDCNAMNPIVSQAEIDASLEFYQPCIEFSNSSYLFDGNDNHTVTGLTHILLKPGFHAGSFTPNGQMHLQIEPKSEIDIVLMGNGSLSNVLRYKKLELGVILPNDLQVKIDRFINNTFGEKINPFVEKNLDVEMEFQHISTGITKIIDGFYFRDFERNDLTNDWDPKATDYPFRVRFAPPLNGKWSAKLKIKQNGIELYAANEFNFNVVESGDPGYVKVHGNQKNLQRGNRMIFPVGHNFPYPDQGVVQYHNGALNGMDWPPNMMHKTAPLSSWKSYLTDIQNYADQGGGFIRIVQAPWSSLIEFEEKGNYSKRLHYAWEQDKLFDLCEEKDILVLFNLMIHEPLMLFGDYSLFDWDWDSRNADGTYDENSLYPKYCYNDDPSHAKKPHHMFLDNDESHLYSDLYYHEQRTRYYISRYGYSTKIYEFELLSEPYHLNEHWVSGLGDQVQPLVEPNHIDYSEVRTAYYNYNERISKYIQNHAEQLVGINFSAPKWDANGDNIYDISASLNTVDILGLNYYAAVPNKLLIEKNDPNDNNGIASGENSFYARINEYFEEFNKPVILPEAGHGDDFASCSNYTGHYVDMMTLGFTGIAGFHSWDGFDHGTDAGVDLQMLWPSTIRAQQHMNGDDVINTLSQGNGSWIQGRQQERLVLWHEAKSKELQYYISDNKELAVGYIKNRSYNVHTKRTNDDCLLGWYGDQNIPIDNLLDLNWSWGPNYFIKELKSNTDYQIDWYSFKNGFYIESNCQNTDGKKFELKHPTLFTTTYDRPIVWFVLKQQNCQKSMEMDSTNIDETFIDSFEIETLKVSPNPFDDKIKVFSKSIQTIKILSSEGVLIIEKEIGNGINEINLPDLAVGVYYLQFTGDCQIFKIVKL